MRNEEKLILLGETNLLDEVTCGACGRSYPRIRFWSNYLKKMASLCDACRHRMKARKNYLKTRSKDE